MDRFNFTCQTIQWVDITCYDNMLHMTSFPPKYFKLFRSNTTTHPSHPSPWLSNPLKPCSDMSSSRRASCNNLAQQKTSSSRCRTFLTRMRFPMKTFFKAFGHTSVKWRHSFSFSSPFSSWMCAATSNNIFERTADCHDSVLTFSDFTVYGAQILFLTSSFWPTQGQCAPSGVDPTFCPHLTKGWVAAAVVWMMHM